MMVNARVVLVDPGAGEVVADCADAKSGQK